MEKERKQIKLNLYYFLSLIYLEVLFKILIFGFKGFFKGHILIMLIYLGILSAFLGLISQIAKNKKINFGVSLFILFFLGVWFSVSFVFKRIFNTFFCISLFGLSDQAIAFTNTAIIEILKNSYGIVLFMLPFLVMLVGRFASFNQANKKEIMLNLIVLVSLVPISFASIYLGKDKNESAYKLINEVDNNALNIEKLGVSVATYLDIKRMIFGFEEVIHLDNPVIDNEDNIEETIYRANTVDIDFDTLIANSKDATVREMHEYFKNSSGTLQNEYTGYFKDKNLIVIMAESFNSIAIDPQLTPTLYQMANSSFVFENFYTPVNLSTIGGEFQDLTGLFANLSILNSYWRKGTNYYPYGLGKVFNDLNYTVNAYHANSGYFQDRNVYLKSIGFDDFLYSGNGLELRMNTKLWPQSDLDLVNATVEDFIDAERFMTYYVSVSGHMPYTKSGNAMTRKNWDLVESLDLSNDAKGYLAANIELDRAVASLIEKLREAGKLDDTVIAIIPDHYPYSLDLKTINELSNYERDSVVEINHSSLIIWNNKMETVKIEKTCSQLDFIPTLYNLFGITYDSRLFMGQDILALDEGLAFFNNRSWVTDKGTYFSSTGKFILKEGQSVSEDYVEKINKIVSNKINMSKLIIEKDYYKKVLGSD